MSLNLTAHKPCVMSIFCRFPRFPSSTTLTAANATAPDIRYFLAFLSSRLTHYPSPYPRVSESRPVGNLLLISCQLASDDEAITARQAGR